MTRPVDLANEALLPSQANTVAPPPTLANAAPLLARYDVIFCDIWGVVHNGLTAFEGLQWLG